MFDPRFQSNEYSPRSRSRWGGGGGTRSQIPGGGGVPGLRSGGGGVPGLSKGKTLFVLYRSRLFHRLHLQPEACRPPRTKYSLVIGGGGDTPSCLGWMGVLQYSWPGRGTPSCPDRGGIHHPVFAHGGTPSCHGRGNSILSLLAWDTHPVLAAPPPGGLGYTTPPRKEMGPMEVLWVWTDRHL